MVDKDGSIIVSVRGGAAFGLGHEAGDFTGCECVDTDDIAWSMGFLDGESELAQFLVGLSAPGFSRLLAILTARAHGRFKFVQGMGNEMMLGEVSEDFERKVPESKVPFEQKILLCLFIGRDVGW